MAKVDTAGAPAAPWRRVAVRLARLAVAAAILAVLFRRVPLPAVAGAIASSRPGPLAAALLAALASQLSIALRLRRLTAALGFALPTPELLRINLAALFYGLFLPGGSVISGIAVRFYKISRSHKDYAGIILALFFDRILATSALCAVGLVFWLVELPRATWPVAAAMLGVLLALVGVQAAVVLGPRLPAAAALARRLPRSLRAALASGSDRSRAFSPRLVADVYGLSLAAQLLGILGWALIAASLTLELGLVTVAWTRAAAVLAAILPVTIAGLGLREGALLALLIPYGVAAPAALAFSLLVFAVTVLAPALLGGLVEAERLLRAAR